MVFDNTTFCGSVFRRSNKFPNARGGIRAAMVVNNWKTATQIKPFLLANKSDHISLFTVFSVAIGNRFAARSNPKPFSIRAASSGGDGYALAGNRFSSTGFGYICLKNFIRRALPNPGRCYLQ